MNLPDSLSPEQRRREVAEMLARAWLRRTLTSASARFSTNEAMDLGEQPGEFSDVERSCDHAVDSRETKKEVA